MSNPESVSSAPSSADNLFPIRHVADITGVNPVTLRAWERRYGLIKPTRTAKGHRLYSASDIERIQHILALLDQGIAISQTRQHLQQRSVSAADESVLVEHSVSDVLHDKALPAVSDEWLGHCQRMREAVALWDVRAIDRVFNDVTAVYPLELVARSLLLPLLSEFYEAALRRPDQRANYRFYHTFICGKLSARLHHVLQQKPSSVRRLLVAGLGNADQQLELLLFALTALSHGISVVYLGVDESALYLPAVLEGAQPDALLLSIGQLTSANAAQVQSLAASLRLPVMLRAVAAETLHGTNIIDALARQLGWHALQGSFADALQQINRVLDS